MKAATIIARVLLGLVFFVLGLNAFFNFIHMPPPPAGPAGDFMTALFTTHYLYAIKVFEISGGALLLLGRFVPLGLTLVGPVLVNILFYDIFMDHSGLPLGLVMAVLALFLLGRYRSSFAGLVRP
jgi:uncharacterized membrane protein YphA (DoxX/SURF4 family)